MRPAILALTLAACITAASGQELVPNGDFEQYTQCPDYVSQIDRATGWSRPTQGTSDYLNACLAAPFSLGVPDNQFGSQAPRSGNGYAGFYCFYETFEFEAPGDDDREYVTHALAEPLVPGTMYRVTFHVSLADASKYAVNDIGALLTVDIPVRPDELPIELPPQITNTGQAWLNDKDGWTTISGCFVADSAHGFITIGNFNTGTNTAFLETPTQFPLSYYSYYFVDDVSVQAMERPDLGADLSACGPVLLSVQDPDPVASYAWSTGEVGASITVDTSGTYSVTTGEAGCSVGDTIVVQSEDPIDVQLPALVDADFCADPHVVIGPSNELPSGVQLLWSTGSSTSTITVDTPGTYTLHAWGTGYCDTQRTLEVRDVCTTPDYLPNAFTPNGDGINDTWQPFGNGAADRTSWSVLDRWGREVFTATTEHQVWTAEELPGGVYVYRYLRNDGRWHSGHVTVVR